MQATSVTVVGGPDAGRRVSLGPGTHLLGRAATAAVRLADPAVEAHHALMTVGAGGTIVITQLCGRQPVRIDGAVPSDAAVAGGARVEVGASRLRIGDRPIGGVDTGEACSVLRRVERQTYLARARAAWTVDLGEGRVRLPLPDRSARPSDLATGTTDEVSLERAEWHDDMPVLVDLAAREQTIIVVRGEPSEVAHLIAHIVRQLPAADDRAVVVGPDRAEALPGGGLTVLVPLSRTDPPPPRWQALIELGDRWRASLTVPGDEFPIRFHAAGCPPNEPTRPGRPQPGRGSSPVRT